LGLRSTGAENPFFICKLTTCHMKVWNSSSQDSWVVERRVPECQAHMRSDWLIARAFFSLRSDGGLPRRSGLERHQGLAPFHSPMHASHGSHNHQSHLISTDYLLDVAAIYLRTCLRGHGPIFPSLFVCNSRKALVPNLMPS
jgi:hypothetical protein